MVIYIYICISIYIYGDSISCGICRIHHIVDTYVIVSLSLYIFVDSLYMCIYIYIHYTHVECSNIYGDSISWEYHEPIVPARIIHMIRYGDICKANMVHHV